MQNAVLDATEELEPLPHQIAGNRHRYSLARAIRRLSDPLSVRSLNGLEGEVSQELYARSQRHPRANERERGFMIPWDAPLRTRNVPLAKQSRSLSTAAGVGAGGIQTTLGRPVIDVLRARSLVGLLGCRVLTDLTGSRFGYPKKATTATVTHVAEDASASSQSNLTLGAAIVFTPNTATAYTNLTHLASVNIPDAEDIIAEDLFLALSVEVDRVACAGSGSAGVPLGLAQNPGIPLVAFGTNGGAPTWPLIASMKRTLGRANADVGSLGLLTTPDAEYKLRTVEKAAGSGFIWDDDNRVCGMPAYATNQLSSTNTKGSSGAVLSSGVMGNWQDAMLGFWGGIEIIINPFTQSTSGVITISAFVDYDFQVRNFSSFVGFADMATT